MLLGQRHECPQPLLTNGKKEYRGIPDSDLRPGTRHEIPPRGFHFQMRAACPSQQRAAERRGQHASRAAFEQVDAELALQLVDRSRHGGLSAEKRRCGPVHATVIHDREERPKVGDAELHHRGGSLPSR